MTETTADRLPPVVYAQVSPISRGGTPLFDVQAVITASQASNFTSDPQVVNEAASRLAAAGFSILQRSPLTINIAGPPSLYEEYFATQLVTEERPVIKPGAREDTATFIDTPDTDVSGLIDTSRSPVADLLEGVAIEEPVYPFQNANPPPLNYWHLEVPARVASLLDADAAHQAGVRGNGVRVTMVDSGWFQHPYFVQRNLQGTVVLGPGTSNPQDDEHGHGTGESANLFAVAPDIAFTMVKISFTNSVGAFNAAVNQTPAPQVVSCSWGSSVQNPPLSAINQALAAAIALAVANGIVVVFSAGNGHFGFPAQHPDVIAAGGVFIDQNSAMRASDYASGFASNVYPGRNVPDVSGLVGMRPRAIYIALPIRSGCVIDQDLAGGAFPNGDETAPNDGWSAFSGTSAAAPQVAGICALLRQVDPGLTPAAVRDLLAKTATDVTVGNASPSTGSPAAGPGFDLATGFGLANAAAAVAAASVALRQVVPAYSADLTGDRRADIVGFGNAGVWVSLNNGDGTFGPVQKVVDNFGYDAGGWRVERHPRFLADLTGDGRADIVGFGNAGVWVSLNQGNGTFGPVQKVVDNFAYDAGGWRVERHPRFLADLTSERRADIVGFGNAGVWVSLNGPNVVFPNPTKVIDNFGYDAGGWRVEKHPRFVVGPR